MNEDLVKLIADIVKEKLKTEISSVEKNDMKVMVGISARHLHLTKEHLEILFGKGYELTKKKDLMGGQFAAEECVTIVGKKLSPIEKVRILGPLRSNTQVEISKTDALKLGVDAPVRESGNIEGSAPITIIGPKGALSLSEGCIVAKRHIHMSPEDAEKFGLKDNDLVSVKLEGERGGFFSNVKVRVNKSFTLEMHIDTDEANAMAIKCGSLLEIVK